MTPDEWTDCPECGARLKESNLDEHMEDVHPHGATSEEERERIQRRQERIEKGKKYGVVAAAVLLVVGGLAVANQMGLLDSGPATGVSCENVAEGRGELVHEHAPWKLYLNNSEPFVPYDFTQRRYQVAAGYVHIEGGTESPIHIHEARPSLGCFLQTLGWSVQQGPQQNPQQMTSDTGVVYPDNATHDLRVLVDGEPAEDGWATPLVGGQEYVIRWTYSPGGTTNTTPS